MLGGEFTNKRNAEIHVGFHPMFSSPELKGQVGFFFYYCCPICDWLKVSKFSQRNRRRNTLGEFGNLANRKCIRYIQLQHVSWCEKNLAIEQHIVAAYGERGR
jgi:hypothetical protein